MNLDRGDFRILWKEHGGSSHGPIVEHVTMPESNFWGFCEALSKLAYDAGRESMRKDAVESLENIPGPLDDYDLGTVIRGIP